MSSRTRVVILGGGEAGTHCLNSLRTQFAATEVSYTVIEPQQAYLYHNAAARAMVNPSFASQCFFSYSNYFRSNEQGEVLHAAVSKLASDHVLLDDNSRVDFDFAVIATGCTSPDSLFQPTTRTRADTLARFQSCLAMIQAAGRIVIVGGGPTGCELACEIRRAFGRSKIITLVHSQPRLLTNVVYNHSKDRLRWKLENLKHIQVILGERCTNFPPSQSFWQGSHTLETDKGRRIDCDLSFFCAASTMPNSGFVKDFDAAALDERGFIKVEPTLQVIGHANVFAAGDVAATGNPKMVRGLEYQSTTVARNIAILAKHKGRRLVHLKKLKDDVIAINLGRWDGLGSLGVIPTPISVLIGPFMDAYVALAKGPNMWGNLLAKQWRWSWGKQDDELVSDAAT